MEHHSPEVLAQRLAEAELQRRLLQVLERSVMLQGDYTKQEHMAEALLGLVEVVATRVSAASSVTDTSPLPPTGSRHPPEPSLYEYVAPQGGPPGDLPAAQDERATQPVPEGGGALPSTTAVLWDAVADCLTGGGNLCGETTNDAAPGTR